MKLRLLVGAVATAAVLLPAAAQAGTPPYQPFSATDDLGDAGDPSNPVVDITTVNAVHNTDRIKLTVGFAGLEQKKYTRYVAAIGDANSARYIEMKTGPSGTPSVAIYKVKSTSENVLTIKCNNVKAIPDYTAGTILFVLPLDCYKNTDPNGAQIFLLAGKWSSSAWQSGPFYTTAAPDLGDDSFSGSWNWFGTPVRHDRGAPHLRFGGF